MMYNFLSKCLVFIYLLLSTSIFSQNLISTQYTTKQKLPSNAIYTLSQDSIGKIWLCTDNGICVYDGKENTYINTINGLAENTILYCHPVSDSKQLISTNIKGLYYRNGNIIKPILPQEMLFTNKFIKVKNYFVVFSANKLNKIYMLEYNPKTDDFIGKSIDLNSKEIIKDVIKVNDSVVVVGTKNYIYKIEFNNHSYKSTIILKINDCSRLVLGNNLLYILNDKKINVVNLKSNKMIDSIKGSKNIGEFSNGIYYNNKMYFSTRLPYKLYCYENTKFNDVTNVLGLKNIDVNWFYIDKENNLWITSQGKGLFRLNESFTQNFKLTTSELNSYVISMHLTKKNDLVVGSYGYFYNVINDSNFIPNYKGETTQYFYHYGFTERGNKIICFVNKVLNFKPIVNNNTKYYYLNTRTAIFINDSIILSGLWSMQLRYYKFYNDKLVRNGDSIVINNSKGRINAIYRINEKEVFVGTDCGLFKINLLTKSIYSYEKEIGTIKINDICFDEKNYYIGSSNGIYIIKENKVLQILKINNQNISSVNKIFYNSKLHQLYIGTNFGLFIFTGKKTFFLNEDNGLSFTEVNAIECKDNYVLVGGVNGYDKVNVIKYINDYKEPITYINSLLINDSLIHDYKNQIKLNNLVKRIQLKFSGIQFKASSIYFKYKINNGIDYLIDKGELNIVDIPYGISKIYLYTSIDLINWSTPLIVEFNYQKPIYYEIWFIVLTIFLCLSFITLFFIWRIKIVKQRNRKREILTAELNSIKLRLVNTSTKAHFLSNVLVGIQQFILQGNVDMASDYLALFSRHMRNVLESFQKDKHTIQNELDLTNEYIKLEKLRFQDKILFTIQSNLSTQAKSVKIPPLLLQPIIENAIEHAFSNNKNTPNTILIQLLEIKNKYIEIMIEDNGIGYNINSINQKSSFGLKVTNERVQLQSNISVFYDNLNTLNQNLSGTRVKFIINII